ncbi:helix-turn-helix domain-containing protein [Sphingomonas sp. AR_OL41]|uniref:IclR family transcriptional regulator n=1 Tax=Sphingomonas sp. AR_OL41 TaxID=3042729 RepID=UPI00247FE7A5|nr:helix-turn-helix domain-containing protein [Sphingomonas sp. AR_OL41]MDH7973910.1 helix-turn-helix domain-containing protein [Sphingomonas sp. AR_OL41]
MRDATRRAKAGAQPNQSLIDGITVLQALAISTEPVGCRELARRVDLETTRVNRLLKTLTFLGIARQTSDRKYRPGSGMTVLAAQSLFASGLLRRALPALEELRRFGHTVAMGVLWRDNVSYLFHAPPKMRETDALGRIGLYPATRGGIGMALLASQDDLEIEETYAGREIPGYENLAALLTAVEGVRSAGYARLRVKDEREQHTVAITIGNPVYAAIGLSGWIPVAAMPDVLAALREAARQIRESGSERGPELMLEDPALDYRVAV